MPELPEVVPEHVAETPRHLEPSLLATDLGGGVSAVFTRRHPGVSTGPWSGLNLGLHVGDAADAVSANRRLLARLLGAPVWFARQVHGTRVMVLAGQDPVRAAAGDAGPVEDGVAPFEGGAAAFETDLGQDDGGYDAVVSTSPGSAVGVLVADCVPVLMADPEASVVAAAHAGRQGLLAGVLRTTLQAMIDSGARADRIRVALGPSAGSCCYEVPSGMRAEVCGRLRIVATSTRWGTPSLDLRDGCRQVLQAAGVRRIQLVGGCTIHDESWYSYRRAQVTGRFAGAVTLAGRVPG